MRAFRFNYSYDSLYVVKSHPALRLIIQLRKGFSVPGDHLLPFNFHIDQLGFTGVNLEQCTFFITSELNSSAVNGSHKFSFLHNQISFYNMDNTDK